MTKSHLGVCYSEPDVGSDLASVKARAARIDGGWKITGTKVWTGQGHNADHLFVLCAHRTVAEIFHGVAPHMVAHLVLVAILVAFPTLVLWLSAIIKS